ncbi:MAG TPA: VOC family protein [Vineibacter sp.]|nr:VOC family protein [Vineibacter sp.]
MSRLFGELRQIGIVVRDIEAAMKHWVEICGVGPWFYVDRLAVTAFSYRGARRDDIHVSIALANSGDVQLELIQQRCATPSMYRDFLGKGHEGMQHWSSWPTDYDARLKHALANGYSIGKDGDSARGRFVYLWNEGHPGTVIEMADLTPARRKIFDAIRTAAVGWDGRDPIRRSWPPGT